MIKLLNLLKESTKDPFGKKDIKQTILKLHGISKDLKEEALNYLKPYTRAGKGKISELNLHPDLEKRLKEKNLPDGFSMGIDKNGYFIHTHRARSKSHPTVDKITEKEIKFISSTG